MKEKNNQGIVQFIKFAVVGVSNTAVDWGVYYLISRVFLTVEDQKSIAKLISFIVAVINSYIWNTAWTFRQEYQKSVGRRAELGKKSAVFLRFAIVSLVGWGVNYLAFRIVINQVPKPDIVALIFASGAAIIWNFFANKFWTYQK